MFRLFYINNLDHLDFDAVGPGYGLNFTFYF